MNQTTKAEYQRLKQEHQLTLMQFSDLKQNYEKIKKLNTTILESMMKEPSEFLHQIKVIIDGSLYNQKVVKLQNELDLLRNKFHEEVERRIQQIMKNIKLERGLVHDCQNCQQCIKIRNKCPSCQKNNQKIKNLQKVIDEKNQRLDRLRLDLEEKKSQYQIVISRRNNQKNQQVQQINRILKANVEELQQLLSQQQIKNQQLQQLNRDWQYEYNNLYISYQNIINELSQYKNYYNESQGNQQNIGNQCRKKTFMVQQIKNLVGELGNNRKSTNFGSQIQRNKPNPYGSRLIGQQSDLSSFSIKDAINRPNQFTFL